MSSFLLSTTKAFLKKSIQPKEQPIFASEVADMTPSDQPQTPVTLLVVGAGSRGKAYTKYALKNPAYCKVVGVAEPREVTRQHFVNLHQIDKTLVFSTWEDLHAASAETLKTIGTRLADAVLVAVQDQMHLAVATAFAKQGYHILCEKPMATSLEDCIRMETAIKDAGVIFGMGHVMRYSPYQQEITEIVRSGSLGRLINVALIEPIGYYHFAHSYVRGNWSKESKAAFSLMTKSCHDIDILCHLFFPLKPSRVSSFGSLQHFRKEAKPAEAGTATRCFDCPIERDCAYSAKKIYLERIMQGNDTWPVDIIVDGHPNPDNVTKALKEGPYGQCVYEADNDVCDNQVVNLEFEDGSTASFTMVAFTSLICERQMRLHFAHGEIVGDMSKYTVTDFGQRKTKTHFPRNEGGGHGGGDAGLFRTFLEAVRTGKQDVLGTDVSDVLNSHLTVFAAETSRREGRIVNCKEFAAKAREAIKPIHENGHAAV